jgi:hypothetical protein
MALLMNQKQTACRLRAGARAGGPHQKRSRHEAASALRGRAGATKRPTCLPANNRALHARGKQTSRAGPSANCPHGRQRPLHADSRRPPRGCASRLSLADNGRGCAHRRQCQHSRSHCGANQRFGQNFHCISFKSPSPGEQRRKSDSVPLEWLMCADPLPKLAAFAVRCRQPPRTSSEAPVHVRRRPRGP